MVERVALLLELAVLVVCGRDAPPREREARIELERALRVGACVLGVIHAELGPRAREPEERIGRSAREDFVEAPNRFRPIRRRAHDDGLDPREIVGVARRKRRARLQRDLDFVARIVDTPHGKQRPAQINVRSGKRWIAVLQKRQHLEDQQIERPPELDQCGLELPLVKRPELIQQVVDLILERELGHHADRLGFLESRFQR